MARPAVARIVVTGATGFVGRHLVPALAADGWEVHALTRGPPVESLGPAQFHVVPDDTAALVDLMAEIAPTSVVHLAALFRGVHRVEDVEPLVRSNVLFTAQMAEAAVRSGTSALIYAGTAWQHYEGAPYSPVALYAATKQAGQDILRFYAEGHGLTVITLKLFDTYGPGDERGKLLSLLADAADSGGVLELSPGEQLIDLLYIDDAVGAFQRALEISSERSGWHEYSLETGRALSIREIVQIVGDVLGRPPAVTFGARPYRPREMRERWSAGEPLPGWRPEVELETGLMRTWGAA